MNITINTVNIIKQLSIFLIAIILYLLNRNNLIGDNCFLREQFNDLLCPLVVLSIINYYSLIVIKRKLFIKFLSIIALITFGIVWWEGLYPIINSNSISDYKDVIAYLVGAIIYWILNKVLDKQ